MFEMLGLFEEARIQYDEIDAVLTQLVINSNSGGKLKRSQSFFLLYTCIIITFFTLGFVRLVRCLVINAIAPNN